MITVNDILYNGHDCCFNVAIYKVNNDTTWDNEGELVCRGFCADIDIDDTILHSEVNYMTLDIHNMELVIEVKE